VTRVAAAEPAPERALLTTGTRTVTISIVVGALLVGFVIVVAREILVTFGLGRPVHGDSYELFAVSLTGLAGGVFAVGLGTARAAPGAERRARLRSLVALAYVATYGAAGALALVVCLVRLGDSTSLLRSLAAAFLGTSIAAATAFFGVTPDGDDGA
jgi:hypothetical protein